MFKVLSIRPGQEGQLRPFVHEHIRRRCGSYWYRMISLPWRASKPKPKGFLQRHQKYKCHELGDIDRRSVLFRTQEAVSVPMWAAGMLHPHMISPSSRLYTGGSLWKWPSVARGTYSALFARSTLPTSRDAFPVSDVAARGRYQCEINLTKNLTDCRLSQI